MSVRRTKGLRLRCSDAQLEERNGEVAELKRQLKEHRTSYIITNEDNEKRDVRIQKLEGFMASMVTAGLVKDEKAMEYIIKNDPTKQLSRKKKKDAE